MGVGLCRCLVFWRGEETRIIDKQTIERLLENSAGAGPQQIVRTAYEQISNLTFACSFGAEDMALLDMIMEVDPGASVFYLDTDVLFAESYELRDRAVRRYGIPNLLQVRPELSLEAQAASYGERLWESKPDECCSLRKIRPLTQTLSKFGGWVTGIRRDQAPTRANTQVFEWDAKFGLVKVNPLAFWTSEQVWDYIRERDIPYNPLHDQGYPSIGCLHCTRPVKPGEDPRSGRWADTAKTECGLHK
jgi:phosphoadenosine phosphosulfate reductase